MLAARELYHWKCEQMPSRTIDAYLKDDLLRAQWQKIKTQVSRINISGYDITNECNLRCEGCFFFEGELSAFYDSSKSDADYRAFFAAEKMRGITYPHFAGAEPALVQNRLRIAAEYWKTGLIYTNGTIKIAEDIPFMIHISVWGGEETDKLLRGGKVLERAIRNYRGDKRALFMYTINPRNINDIETVVKKMAANELRISFNHYSASRQYKNKVTGKDVTGQAKQSKTYRLSDKNSNLIFSANDLLRSKDLLRRLIAEYPETVIYSHAYNDFVHQPGPIFDIDPETGVARNCAILSMPYHRQYHTDFSFSDSECCIANVDCSECRHYVSIYTLIMSKMREAVKDPGAFAAWLDTYYTWCRIHFVGWDTLQENAASTLAESSQRPSVAVVEPTRRSPTRRAAKTATSSPLNG